MTNYNKILIKEPFSVYLAKSKEYLTSHLLMEFSRCPFIYHLRQVGSQLFDLKPSADFVLGQAAHTLILEGQAEFDQHYVVGGPINEKTGKEYGRDTQAYAKWLEIQKAEKGSSFEAITEDQWQIVSNMHTTVNEHLAASLLLESGVAERVVRTDLFGHEVQIRMDWFREFDESLAIVDLKTCGDLDTFQYDAKKYLYGIQFAFYRRALSNAMFEEFSVRPNIEVYVIAVEKKIPFRVGVFKLGVDTLESYEYRCFELIDRLQECERTDQWPTLYEGVQALEIH